MPEKTTSESSLPLDWNKAKAYIEETIKFYEQFAGRKGMNPFFFIQSKIAPLVESLSNENPLEIDSIRTPELYNAIMSLPQDEKYAVAPKMKPIERSYSKLAAELDKLRNKS